jgi:hypothetical protein
MNKKPTFHELKYVRGHYARAYWPIEGGTEICVKNDSKFKMPNGSEIQVKSIFEGKSFPMINYSINGTDKIESTPLHWFVDNIAKKTKK